MILPNERTIFVHIPRCGGTSLNTWFKDNNLFNGKMHWNVLNLIHLYGVLKYRTKTLELDHLTLHQMKRFVAPYVFEESFKFAVVRNPTARMLSVYKRAKHEGDFRILKHHDNSSFLKFCNNLKDIKKHFDIRGIDTCDHFRFTHFLPQSAYICDEHDNILVDLIIPLSDLNHKTHILKTRLNINSFDHHHYKSEQNINIDQKEIQQAVPILQSLYPTDYKLWGDLSC